MDERNIEKDLTRMPKLSIIVPVYNTGPYLRRCADSLLAQDIRGYEIIMVNDGSTDDSPSICDGCAASDKRVRVIHKSHGGPSRARNTGIENASGDYLLFVDSDDAIETNVLPDIQKSLNDHAPDIITLKSRFFQGGRSGTAEHGIDGGRIITGKEFLLNTLRNGTMLQNVGLYGYRREFMIKNRLEFKPDILHEDAEFTPRALLAADKVLCSSINFYRRYVREGSITTNPEQMKNAIDILTLCKELKSIYDHLPDSELKMWLYNSLAENYLDAIRRGKLMPSKDRQILRIFSPEGLACRKSTALKVKLFTRCPHAYKIIQYIYSNLRRFLPLS